MLANDGFGPVRARDPRESTTKGERTSACLAAEYETLAQAAQSIAGKPSWSAQDSTTVSSSRSAKASPRPLLAALRDAEARGLDMEECLAEARSPVARWTPRTWP